MFKKIISILLALAMIFACSVEPAYAITEAEKEAYEEKIQSVKGQIEENKKKIESLETEAKNYNGEINNLQDSIGVLQEQIELYTNEITLINNDIADVDNQISSIEYEIDVMEKDIEKLDKEITSVQNRVDATYTLLGERIRAKYMSDSSSVLEFLLCDDDFSLQTYLERTELMERITKHDNEMVKSLRESIDDLEEKVQRLDDTKTQKALKIQELDRVKKDLDVKKQDLVDAKNSVTKNESKILTNLETIKNRVSQLNRNSKECEEAIEKGESEIAEYELKIAQEDASYGDASSATGMIWPFQYPNTYISSSYGTRVLNGVVGQHHGVDICVGDNTYGRNISAVQDGYVDTACHSGYNGGFGLYVVIDHGTGVKTYYCHMSSVYVNAGDYVKQGDFIGAAGNTGYSFGSHLHFAVLVNGCWDNPLNYVDKPADCPVWE